jgi:exopolysaccharide biosynthesis polyprenyl glycosylphosphotransferase
MIMFSHRFSALRKINISMDAFISAFSVLLAIMVRAYTLTGRFYVEYLFYDHLWVVLVAFFLWPILLSVNGLYPTDRLRQPFHAVWIILKSCLQGVLFIVILVFMLKIRSTNRLIIGLFFLNVAVFLSVKELLVIYSVRAARSSGKNIRNVLVVGTAKSVSDITRKLKENTYLGLHVLGLLVPEEEAAREVIAGAPVLGDLGHIERTLHKNPVDHVIVTIDKKDYKDVEGIIAHCEEEGVEIWVTADIFKITFAKLDAGDFFGKPMFILRTTPRYSWQLFFKSLVDRAGSLILSILTLPLILAAALLIKLTSSGPVLFMQKRCGLQGRQFTLFKLRTMYTGAHKAVEGLKAENILTGPVFKMKDDPRITPVGRFLRKYSIDELPQLWNVLMGDMSLVGPRPPLPEEVEQYKGWQRRRLSMKPGITGLWQVSGRNELTFFDEWVGLDLEYIDKWSLALDIKILLRTVLVVLTSRGAH